MGCASSAPLVEQGKNLVKGVKDTANETIAKGEKAIHETTDTLKDGVETVKETVQSAFNTTEESVGSVAQKIGETFHLTTSKTSELVDESKDRFNSKVAATTEAAAEAVSEAETVIVSEAEHAREAFQSGTSPFFETVHSLNDDFEDIETKAMDHFESKTDELGEERLMQKEVEESINKSEDMLMEDLENDHHLGETVKKEKEKVEELQKEEEDCQKQQPQKEDPPPTFWEASADANLTKRTIRKLEPLQDRLFFPPSEKLEADSKEKKAQENDIVIENTDN